VSASRNPPSVLNDITLCSLPEPVTGTYGSVWPCFMWDRFSFRHWKPQGVPSSYSRWDFFLFCCQPSLAIHLQITHPVWREEFPLP